MSGFTKGFLALPFIFGLSSCSLVIPNMITFPTNHSYSYFMHGLDWVNLCQSGHSQSPINIVPSQAIPMSKPKVIQFGIPPSVKISLHVTPYSVVLMPAKGEIIKINSGQPVDGNFILTLSNFHWRGEHTIDGVTYDLELHNVFFNEKYKHLNDAGGKPDGICIYSILYSVGNEDGLLKKILYGVENIYKEIDANFDELIPSSVNSYYQYEGSLTVPPCNEHVKWMIDKNVRSLSATQARSTDKACRICGLDLQTASRIESDCHGSAKRWNEQMSEKIHHVLPKHFLTAYRSKCTFHPQGYLNNLSSSLIEVVQIFETAGWCYAGGYIQGYSKSERKTSLPLRKLAGRNK